MFINLPISKKSPKSQLLVRKIPKKAIPRTQNPNANRYFHDRFENRIELDSKVNSAAKVTHRNSNIYIPNNMS